jgi:hypothetical protein
VVESIVLQFQSSGPSRKHGRHHHTLSGSALAAGWGGFQRRGECLRFMRLGQDNCKWLALLVLYASLLNCELVF